MAVREGGGVGGELVEWERGAIRVRWPNGGRGNVWPNRGGSVAECREWRGTMAERERRGMVIRSGVDG